MWDREIGAMSFFHAFMIGSVFTATVLPPMVWSGFSVYGTHLLWIYAVSSTVAVDCAAMCWMLNRIRPTKKHTLGYKLSRCFRACLYSFLSCLFFHTVLVLYGAPLIESALETFSLAVLLTSLTTMKCLCILGSNVQAWIRVFSQQGAISIWDTCVQITVACPLIGAWLGAFPIPLDWDRPWQVWPVSCSFGAVFGYLTGLVIAPAWIYYHRKQPVYKSK